MFTRLYSAATLGINASRIDVEVYIENGIFRFLLVGLPDSAVKESRERVISAIRNSSLKFPFRRIILNLAPADLKKEGAAFDLPIALSLMVASDVLPSEATSNYLFVGELSLDGALRHVKGILPIAIGAKKWGMKGLVLPRENAEEASVVEGLNIYPMQTLQETVAFLCDGIIPDHTSTTASTQESSEPKVQAFWDYKDVKGQEHVKRAFEVAAAGGHNIIMVGPPGSGKTMIAKRLPGILPDMAFEEALETTKIHSVAGLLPARAALVAQRPFRSPHHTLSDTALVGGGSIPRPGEISLAHNGVLFLDELPEFRRSALEVLRQPLEEGRVLISRSKISIEFPAKFMLVAAMNPCPCGMHTDPVHECRCSYREIFRYRSKISGPLLDRIDIHLDVPSISINDLMKSQDGESSSTIRERVSNARAIQYRRFAGDPHAIKNADMGSVQLRKFCALNLESRLILEQAITKFGLSARAYDRILRVARTIADLGISADIQAIHIAEAIQYRTLDRRNQGNS